MSTEIEETKSTEQPYRRLHVVPARFCTSCVQHKGGGKYGEHMCGAGDTKTSPVTGDWWYITKCADKNAYGDCQDFVAIDKKAVAKQARRDSWGHAALVLLSLLFISAILTITFPM